MKTVEIKLILTIDDDSKPNKWVPDVIWEVLNENEDILDFQCKDLIEND